MRTPITASRRLTAVVAGLALLALPACEYSELDGIGTRTADAEHPPQRDVTAFEGCEPAELDRWRARGEVVNPTDRVASYEVVVGFYDGEVRLDERSEWIRDLGPGETAAIDRAWWIDGPDRVTDCRVLLVNRFG
ncbi:MAG: hypothetical protein AAFO29_13765 [Actinomycetota bacterium]